MRLNSLFFPKIDEIPKPGLRAQLKMAPPHRLSDQEVFLNVPAHARKAAVMMLLYPNEQDELYFCLIQRSTYIRWKALRTNKFPWWEKRKD